MNYGNYEYDLLVKLVESGDIFATREMIRFYLYDNKQDINLSPIDNQKILHYIKKLAMKGDGDAMLLLGSMYYSGEAGFVKQDFKKAAYWYEKSSKKGILDSSNNINTDSLTNLGYCYYYGRISKPDYKKAFFYYAKASILKHPNSMYKIGDMYRKGLYVEKNVSTAIYWYRKAMRYCPRDSDYILASVGLRLGRCYLYGEGTKKSLMKALNYLQLAERKFYKLAIDRPIASNSIFVEEPLKIVHELLEVTRNEIKEGLFPQQ